ncbi:MAG: hypothetical protein KatS3mg082_2407 [Nitrospiraceae bacterium]|nr:MAG: hypothetical protein KatS3mg082_2407 [Nitrospiraceae bacterium]
MPVPFANVFSVQKSNEDEFVTWLQDVSDGIMKELP